MEIIPPSLREQGIQALREGNLDEAIDVLTRTVLANGADAEAQMFLGVAYSQKGLYTLAQRALETAVVLRPQEPRCHFNLGAALEQAGDVSGAGSAYRRALQIHPDYLEARAKIQALSGKLQASPVDLPPAGGEASGSGMPRAPWLADESARPAVLRTPERREPSRAASADSGQGRGTRARGAARR